ncbi:MAG TPA: STAS domain-containing protein [Holophagaceae bacterium]|nr:STAS domain-containing protein [Holophagaceae bacterium]
MLTFESTQRKGKILIQPKGELTIFTAAQAKREFADALEAHADPEVDLSAVEELDTAGVQILLWARREAAHRGRTLPFVDHSPVVMEVFDLLNLVGIFGDPIFITPSQS